MNAQAENNFHNRVDVLAIPEGWLSVAYELVKEIDEHVKSYNYQCGIPKEWKISQIEINRHGKLTVTGTHIRNFEHEIHTVAKIAEEVCCVCGNQGKIEVINQDISLPLCSHHLRFALSKN
jgi:hypothetical protein